jgi:hypothetical protein
VASKISCELQIILTEEIEYQDWDLANYKILPKHTVPPT